MRHRERGRRRERTREEGKKKKKREKKEKERGVLTGHNVLVDDLHVLITVGASVLVPEANHVT